MKLSELIEKGFIDADDDIDFRVHKDVMRLFGTDKITPRKNFHNHPYETGVHIWLPIFYQAEDNDWENTWGQHEESVFEKRIVNNEGYLRGLFNKPDDHKRILFAKIQQGRIFYKFKGIYNFDPELSTKAKKAAYRRIATTAKLYPLK